MSRTATFQSPVLRADVVKSDGRELVVFESIVALLALLLIVFGFSLYVTRTYNTSVQTEMPNGAIQVSIQPVPAHEPPLSLAEI